MVNSLGRRASRNQYQRSLSDWHSWFNTVVKHLWRKVIEQ